MSEPAHEFDDKPSALDELDSILREADASRRRPAGDSKSPAAPAGPSGPAPARTTPADVSPAGHRAEVKFDRYDIKVPDVGENKIQLLEIPKRVPIITVLAVVIVLVWCIFPSGIQLLRPQAIPDSYVDSSARWILAVTMERIERFEEEQQRLPQSLDELDPSLSEVMTYQRLPDGGYSLMAPGHKGMLTLTNDMPQEVFLGHVPIQLRRAPGASQ